METNLRDVAKLIFEMGQLKREPRSGWTLAGVKSPETVAEHNFRTAIIAYILAIMEGCENPERVAFIALIHDNAESRIGDPHKVRSRYIHDSAAEQQAFVEQAERAGETITSKLTAYFDEYKARSTKDGIVAKDADWLECAFQAKEYLDLGYASAQGWIDAVEKALETESAKKIFSEMKTMQFTDWWDGLKKMTYTKLS